MRSSVQQPRYRWLILSLTWSAFLVTLFTRLGIGPLGPFLKDGFRISNTQVGWLAGASIISYAPALLLTGWLADRFGVRLMMTVGTALSTICNVAVFFAPSYSSMFVMLLISGLGTACVFPAAVKAAMLWFPPWERGMALGVHQTSVNFTGIACAAILPTVAIALGWQYGFLFLAVFGGIVSLACGFLYHDPPAVFSLTDRAGVLSAAPQRRFALSVLKSRDVWTLALCTLSLSFLEFAVLAQLVLYLKEGLLFSAVAAGGLMAITQAAGALGKPASGFISDRWLRSRKIVLLAMAGGSGFMCLVLALSGRGLGWLLYPVLAVTGFMAIGWGGIYVSIAGELKGKEQAGVVSGTVNALTCLGALGGPPLFGYIVDATGSYQIAWLAMAGFGAVSVLVGCFIREQKSLAAVQPELTSTPRTP